MKRIVTILYVAISSAAFGQQIDIPFGYKPLTLTYDRTQSALNMQYKRDMGPISFKASRIGGFYSENLSLKSKDFNLNFTNLHNNKILNLNSTRKIGSLNISADVTKDNFSFANNIAINGKDWMLAYHNSYSSSYHISSAEFRNKVLYANYDMLGNYNLRVNHFATGRINNIQYYEMNDKGVYLKYQDKDFTLGLRNIKGLVGIDYRNTPYMCNLGLSLNTKGGLSATAGYDVFNSKMGVLAFHYSCKF